MTRLIGPAPRRSAAVALAVVVLGLVLPAAASNGPRIVRSLAANLDEDRHVERIQVLDYLRPNPYGGSEPLHAEFARILDESGGRPFGQRISPVMDYVRVAVVQTGIRDVAESTFLRAVWYAGSTGNSGAAPSAFGLVGWTGGGANFLWSYRSSSSSLGRRYDGAGARLFEDPIRGGPGPEIRLEEGIHHPGDPYCCPRTVQVSLYRFGPNANARRYVLYARFVRPS